MLTQRYRDFWIKAPQAMRRAEILIMARLTGIMCHNYRNSFRTGCYLNMKWHSARWPNIALTLLINLSKKCFGGFIGKAGWNIDQRCGMIMLHLIMIPPPN